MADKNTEYVNAQFDDAEERIEDLFKEISKEDTPAKTNEVAVTYCYMTWGWFHNSNIVFYTGGSPCSPRDFQESSPTPQFKSINSSALSLLHSPTLTSIHDYWKNQSLD